MSISFCPLVHIEALENILLNVLNEVRCSRTGNGLESAAGVGLGANWYGKKAEAAEGSRQDKVRGRKTGAESSQLGRPMNETEPPFSVICNLTSNSSLHRPCMFPEQNIGQPHIPPGPQQFRPAGEKMATPAIFPEL